MLLGLTLSCFSLTPVKWAYFRHTRVLNNFSNAISILKWKIQKAEKPTTYPLIFSNIFCPPNNENQWNNYADSLTDKGKMSCCDDGGKLSPFSAAGWSSFIMIGLPITYCWHYLNIRTANCISQMVHLSEHPAFNSGQSHVKGTLATALTC